MNISLKSLKIGPKTFERWGSKFRTTNFEIKKFTMLKVTRGPVIQFFLFTKFLKNFFNYVNTQILVFFQF